MSPRLTAILLLAAITVQTVLGGLPGAVGLCLGGGHEHGPAEVAGECELACEHESGFPRPVPLDGHDCPCNDVELSLVELVSVPRDEAGAGAIPLCVLSATWAVEDAGQRPRGLQPRPRCEDPGGGRLALIRSTRLII